MCLFDHELGILAKTADSIQLNPLCHLTLYTDGACGPGEHGNLWLQHHREFCYIYWELYTSKNIGNRRWTRDLSKNYAEKYPNGKMGIIDPILSVSGVNATYVKVFSTIIFVAGRFWRNCSFLHVIEHMYDPSTFMKIFPHLPQGSMHFFSIPNLEENAQRKYTSCWSIWT